jgi:hypothetical protein
MIIYNVTVNVDNSIADDWLQWMKDVHIPDVMKTGMFLDNHIYRVLAEDDSGMTYAIQYWCADMFTYEMYRDQFAPALQSDVLNRYGDKFVAFRTLLEVVK